jgi:hypothetical protein
MLPTPDFRAMYFAFAVEILVPVLLVAFITIVAALAGADRVGRLSKFQYVLATAGGVFIGWSLIASVILIGLFVVVNWIGVMIMLFVAAILGPLGAFNTARMLGQKMGRLKVEEQAITPNFWHKSTL